MNVKAVVRTLSRYRHVSIDDIAAGHPFRLSVLGKPLKSRPGRCWATTVVKIFDLAEFEALGGKQLAKIAGLLEGGGFTLANQTNLVITLAGFPPVEPGSTISLCLGGQFALGQWSIRKECLR